MLVSLTAKVVFEHEEKCRHTGKTPTVSLLLHFLIPVDLLQETSIETVVVLPGVDIFLHTHQLFVLHLDTQVDVHVLHCFTCFI